MALNEKDKNWILEAFSKMLALTEARLEKRTDGSLDEKLSNHPRLVKMYNMLDKVLGNQVKDKDELDIISSKVYDDLEPRVTALEK